jgi:hypothetical protein
MVVVAPLVATLVPRPDDVMFVVTVWAALIAGPKKSVRMQKKQWMEEDEYRARTTREPVLRIRHLLWERTKC